LPSQNINFFQREFDVAFVQVMADQRKESAVAFLEAAVVYFAKLGASSKPRFANGLTPVPTRTRINDLLSYSTGSIATIGHMVA
jgi:hypothetical protein